MKVILVGGSTRYKNMARQIEQFECIVRMKTGNKLSAEDVGRRTNYLAITHYRHWRQSKVKPIDGGWIWSKKIDGPLPGEPISVLQDPIREMWVKKFEAHNIPNPSFGLMALVMTLEFLNPSVIVCAACDSFFGPSDPPGSTQERRLLSQLPIEELKA